MAERVRPYLYYDVAISICDVCFRKVEGKIVFEDGKVLLMKRCREHGARTVLLADDVDYWRRAREVFLKPSEMPVRFNTPVRWGCPYDCGLCADHEQHSCLTLIEICDDCNLACPICYAASGPHRKNLRPLAQVERMLDAVVRNEGEPDVVQISGGEPTVHPEFFEILDAAKRRPIRHLMVNSNGIRMANDPEFVKRLASYMPGFEVYLQFDSLEREPQMRLRGADLRDIRRRALENLDRAGISTTLVVTLQKGLNDSECGAIIDHALQWKCVRGVTFQPIQDAGRAEGFDPAKDRLTLSEVRRAILSQSSVFRPEDVLPVPCHPDCLAMAYALKVGGKVTPLTGLIDPQVLIEGGRNTIVFEKEAAIRGAIFKAFSTNHSPESAAASLKDLLCCLPKIALAGGLSYENVFRVLIVQFLDAHSFDVRSVKKTCIHIVHPDDGRLIPFDTYNLFYRDDLERTRLAPLRAEVERR
ncbi:MAG: radical SAM protein [Planctomycetes bacterium]|nr:radical SAM protein [Planctomycetota bacterium]